MMQERERKEYERQCQEARPFCQKRVYSSFSIRRWQLFCLLFTMLACIVLGSGLGYCVSKNLKLERSIAFLRMDNQELFEDNENLREKVRSLEEKVGEMDAKLEEKDEELKDKEKELEATVAEKDRELSAMSVEKDRVHAELAEKDRELSAMSAEKDRVHA